MTNFDKLTRWDADFYKSLTDDDCIVCLSEKQIYVLGQVIEQVTWIRTRWTGDITELDFDEIASDINYRLSERMTCETLTTLLNTVNNLTTLVQNLQTQLSDYINPDADYDITSTSVNDILTPSELEEFGVSTDGCDSADRDEIYGAVSQLVRYINQRNVDFLQNFSQTSGLPENLSRLISATPIVGLLPADEAVDYVSFLLNEVVDEYDATVDEALLQQTICDIFCIAVNNGCSLDFNDVFNYFSSKVDPNFSNTSTTFLDLVQFGISGTFTSDMYFYFMCYFQLLTIGSGQYWLGLNTLNDYAYQTRAGLNSPDNDWSIFCISCPTQYRLWTHDFAIDGQGDFVLNTGTYESGRIKGAGSAISKSASITLSVHDATWQVKSIKVYYERVGGDGLGGLGHNRAEIFMTPTFGSSNISNCGDGFGNGNVFRGFNTVPPADDGTALGFLFVADNTVGTVEIYIDKIEILYTVINAPVGAIITEDSNLCT